MSRSFWGHLVYVALNSAVTRKRVIIRASKKQKFGLREHMRYAHSYVDLEYVKVILRSLGALFSQLGHNSKCLSWSETDKNLGLLGVYRNRMHMGILLISNMSRLFLGLLCALKFPELGYISKVAHQVIIEPNKQKFGAQMHTCVFFSCGYFWPQKCQCYFGVIPCTFLPVGS